MSKKVTRLLGDYREPDNYYLMDFFHKANNLPRADVKPGGDNLHSAKHNYAVDANSTGGDRKYSRDPWHMLYKPYFVEMYGDQWRCENYIR